MMDGLSGDLAFVNAVLDGVVEALVRRGVQTPRTVPRARAILDRAIAAAAMSQLGQSDSGDASGLDEDDLIGPSEAAKLTGYDRKTLQRRPEDFGGRRVAGRLVFSRNELEGVLDGCE
jgi:hypothetical protein